MKNLLRRSKLLLCLPFILILSSCGGGGDGGNTAGANSDNNANAPLVATNFAALSLSQVTPASLDMTIQEGEVLQMKTLNVKTSGDVNVLNGKTLYVIVEDPLQLFENNASVSINYSDKSGNIQLLGKSKVLSVADSAQGKMRIYVCLDAQCNTQLGNSPLSVPYSLNVIKNNGSGSVSSGGRQWQKASLIADNVTNLKPSDTTIDADGNALRVWQGYNSNNYPVVWFNTYSPLSGWGTPRIVSVESTTLVSISGVKIKMDSNGNALAVWEEGYNSGPVPSDVSLTYPWSAQYIKGKGWQQAQRITNPQNAITYNSLAFDMNSDGSAFALWSQQDGVWSAKFATATGWQNPIKLGSRGSIDSYTQPTKIGVDAKGNAYAMWMWDQQPMYTKYSTSNGWQESAPISVANDIVSGNFNTGRNFAVSPDGSVMILYEAIGRTFAIRLPAGSNQWEKPVAINFLSGLLYPANSPRMLADSVGGFHVVWARQSETGDSTSKVYYRQYAPSTGWQASTVINNSGEQSSRDPLPNIAINAQNDLVIAWTAVYPLYEQGAIYAKNYSVAGGWSNVALIGPVTYSPYGFQEAREISLAMSPNGTAIASWYTSMPSDSDSGIWMNLLK